MTLHYLATPYSKYPGGIEAAYIDACRATASLLRQGIQCYSPIAHTHGIAVHGGLDPLDHDLWLPFDEAMMKACEVLIICRMEGWERSKGIKYEEMRFLEMGKKVEYCDFDVESGETR
jgi:hypothetical protein